MIKIKKGRAVGKPRPAEVVAGGVSGEVVFETPIPKSRQWQEYLDANPKKAKQYAEAIKKPHKDRLTVCEFCKNPYIVPCLDAEDNEKCMNWAFLQGTYDEKFGTKKKAG